MKLSDYVIERVAKEVDHIFMLVGGGCMHLVDSVGRCKNLEYVCNLHEQACAIAAEAYAQYTGFGVGLVTTGPGGTNALTGVAAAWMDSTPCLFISGQVKRADSMVGKGIRQMGFQEINIVDIVKPITKYAKTVTEPNSIRCCLETAIHIAKRGRPGPVWIDIPLDVQAAEIDVSQLWEIDIHRGCLSSRDYWKLQGQVGQAIQLLSQAKKPVILLGNGARGSNYWELLDILQIPVLTTWKAIDLLSEDDPYYLGRPGAIGQRGANFAQQNADFIMTIGARLDLGQTGYNHAGFAKNAKKVVVDIDQSEIDKLDMEIDIPICADAKDFVKELIQQEPCAGHTRFWWQRCLEWKRKYPVILPKYWKDEGVNNYVLVDVLSEEMSRDDLLIPGSSGACSEVVMQAFRVREGQCVFNSPGLGSMGFGIPASIGGCVASGRRTICIEGDGGFQMNIQELETVKRLNLPIKFFVLNNGGYGSIQATQERYFEGRYVGSNPESGMTLPDILKVAIAYGIPTVRIDSHKHIRERVRQVLDMEGPVVCETISSPDQVTAPRLSSRQGEDGSMESAPMEDLWPFLPRDEFLVNMGVVS